jgi:fused signal recognition particle receptor
LNTTPCVDRWPRLSIVAGRAMEIEIVVVVLLALAAFIWFRSKKSKLPALDDDIDVAPPKVSAEPKTQVEALLKERQPMVPRPLASESDAAPEPNPIREPINIAPIAPEIHMPVDPALGLPSIAPVEAVPPPPDRSRDATRVTSHVDFQSLRRGLAKSRKEDGFFGKLRSLLGGRKEIDPKISEEIEELLLTSDVGVKTTERILGTIKERLKRGELSDEGKVWEALSDEACRILDVDGRKGGLTPLGKPTVVLFVGVNGAGKTTTIGKLAKQLKAQGKTVMLAAGDTFRAAAVEQLRAWGERTSCEVAFGKEGADPSSVLFDAANQAASLGVDFLLADTAGRLHTKANLMQEMSKIARTLSKALPGAPQETFLVVDSTNGQNALAQAREFKEALPLTGLVLTKLDGTARGGVVLGIADTLGVPVRYVGVGERTEDLQEFGVAEFVEALLGREEV